MNESFKEPQEEDLENSFNQDKLLGATQQVTEKVKKCRRSGNSKQ